MGNSFTYIIIKVLVLTSMQFILPLSYPVSRFKHRFVLGA